MLLSVIAAFLGASVFSDKDGAERRLYHTVFTWNNGGEIRRIFNIYRYFDEMGILVEEDETYFFHYNYIDYCIGDRHTILSIHPYRQLGTKSRRISGGKVSIELLYSPQEEIDEVSHEEEGARICWLILFYLDEWFYPDYESFSFQDIGFPKIYPTSNLVDHLEYVRNMSSDQEPDGIDPYELTVYKTGQMQNSFFFMSTDDCLKVLGC